MDFTRLDQVDWKSDPDNIIDELRSMVEERDLKIAQLENKILKVKSAIKTWDGNSFDQIRVINTILED